MAIGVLILHALFSSITGACYVSYPVVGGMVKDLFPKYSLEKKNLIRILLDTGTGLAPLAPWSTNGSYTAALGAGHGYRGHRRRLGHRPIMPAIMKKHGPWTLCSRGRAFS